MTDPSYPPSAQFDPNAPFNQPDATDECDMCEWTRGVELVTHPFILSPMWVCQKCKEELGL